MFSTSCSTPSFNTTFHFACFLLHQYQHLTPSPSDFQLLSFSSSFFMFSCTLNFYLFIHFWLSISILNLSRCIDATHFKSSPPPNTHTHCLPFTNAIFSHHLRAVTKPQLALCFIPITFLPHHPPLGPLNHRIQYPTNPKRLIEPPFLSFPRHQNFQDLRSTHYERILPMIA